MVEYTYDSWGKLISTTGTLAETLGKLNPFRYRGYIYDEEIECYWLRTRYYNPEMGRFLNADSYVSTGTGLSGYNMFAYCNNNPIINVDYNGDFPWVVVFIVGCALIGGVYGYCYMDENFFELNSKSNTDSSNNSSVNSKMNEDITSNNRKNEDIVSNYEEDSAENNLTQTDRIINAVACASLGMATGGAIASGVGAIACVVKGSTALIFGATASQTFAIGALAYDSFVIFFAPFVGLEDELIEWVS